VAAERGCSGRSNNNASGGAGRLALRQREGARTASPLLLRPPPPSAYARLTVRQSSAYGAQAAASAAEQEQEQPQRQRPRSAFRSCVKPRKFFDVNAVEWY
jgi:hypothetical protein